MKAPKESPDPLFQSLADEAGDLPLQAATEARRRAAQRRDNRGRLALAATLSALGLITWVTFQGRDTRQTTIVATHSTSTDKAEASSGSSASGNGTGHAPAALPEGLSPEQNDFVKSMEDMPILLVRDASGKVARIHVIAR